jgi:hypothetical protein
MDPVSVIRSTKELVDLCFKVSDFIENTKNVDLTFRFLESDVHGLQKVLNLVNETVENQGSSTSAIRLLETKYEREYWRLVHRSMEDCKETLESLGKTLDTAKKENGQFLRRERMQWHLNLRSGKIGEFRQRIMGFTNTLQITLQLIMMYIPFPFLLIQFLGERQRDIK